MREAIVETYLVNRVNSLDGITAKMTVKGRRGWPDRLVVMPNGKIYLVELKRPKGGVLSPTQYRLHMKLHVMGHAVHCLESPEAVDRFIAQYLHKEI